MFLSTNNCSALVLPLLQNQQMVGDITQEHISDGMAHIARAYGMDPGSTKFALALGLKSQQTLQGIIKRGSAKRSTLSQIRERTWVSLDWLTARVGKDFPNGLNPSFKAGSTDVRQLETDIDVLRNTVIVLATALGAKQPSVGRAVVSLLRRAPYADRGYYDILIDEIQKAIASSQEESPSAAPRAVTQRAQSRQR